MADNYSRGEISKIILQTTLAIGLISLVAVAPGVGQIVKYLKKNSKKDIGKFKRSIHRLKKKGLLVEKEAGIFALTPEGEKYARKHYLENLTIKTQNKWDKKWRVIMFDVPEAQKQARRGVNFVLKKLGCVQYQKSVFITPFPCENEIGFVGDTFGIRKNIKLIVAESVEGEVELRKVFGL